MSTTFHWFRRDLRLEDNAALYHALRSGNQVQCIFIFDSNILEKLENKEDRRLVFIHQEVERLHRELSAVGSGLVVLHGKPDEIWKKLAKEYQIVYVFTNHDYEPYAKKRDDEIGKLFQSLNISFHTCKDQVIFEKSEIVKDDGSPYLVFTPYMKAWRKKFNAFYGKSYPTEKYFSNFVKSKSSGPLPIESYGFKNMNIEFPPRTLNKKVIEQYAEQRDIPSVNGTSRLSLHLRFGTVSIRQLVNAACFSEKWVNELIWREFYMMILWHFPHVTEKAFKSQYDLLEWRNDEDGFLKWCNGQTGYPIVDAGMRELNATGFMHNRVRMIVAMFLTKYLLIDWRWGEAYFAEKLLDFELSSNNGGWQWSAGTGVDAAPYFRIFNMDEQTKRFDPELKYVRKWVPEFQELTYPKPMVDYKMARERCLKFFKARE